MTRLAIAGAGLSGAVLARDLAENGDHPIVVFEAEDHVGGHCHTERDPETGIMLHVHGAHVLHTSDPGLWAYVSRFAELVPLEVRVKAVTRAGVYSLPVNLLTINQFFHERFDPRAAKAFIEALGDESIEAPRSFEEYALRHVGRELYEAFFLGYTLKQWGTHPRDLPASIAKRLPIRYSYDDRYLRDDYQGVPREGYTALIERLLDHPLIELRTGERFTQDGAADFGHTFFTGPLDSYFEFRRGRLPYRSLRFERVVAEGDFQGGPLMTYCDEAVPYTRVIEHKHLSPWESHQATVVHREFSFQTRAGDTPYYPLRQLGAEELLDRYIALANEHTTVTFLGRLGTYRYLDMNVVIGEARDMARRFVEQPPSRGREFAAFGETRRPSPA